jgi:hypothetical protein
VVPIVPGKQAIGDRRFGLAGGGWLGHGMDRPCSRQEWEFDMAGNAWRGNPVAVSDLASQILDPVLRRRAGMSVALVQSWEEIVGPRPCREIAPGKDSMAA